MNGALAPPQLRMISPCRGPVQKTLWKVALSLGPSKVWKGNYTYFSKDNYTFIFEETQIFYLQACLRTPYVFLVETITINQMAKLVKCPQCHLYIFLNLSIYNASHDQIMILPRRQGLWLTVQAPRVWEGSPTVHVVLQLLHKILHRTKRFIGLLIAAIMGIIAITTMAAVSGVALHQTVQTTQFVQEWHENDSKAWNQQVKIDQELSVGLADLEATVVYLRDQLENLQTMITLKCDWNVSCVTSFSYNHSHTPWSEV